MSRVKCQVSSVTSSPTWHLALDTWHLPMRWLKALVKAVVAVLLALLCATAPLAEWTPPWFIQLQALVVLFVLVCYLGKLMYDTLFYDHYHP